MALADHYRVLGLRTGASFGDVKLAYRNLARLYHPDVNPGDQRSKEKFIQITQSYRVLAESLVQNWSRHQPQQDGKSNHAAENFSASHGGNNRDDGQDHGDFRQGNRTSETSDQASLAHPTLRSVPGASAADQQLKIASFGKLRDLFHSNRFPRAVALVEGLSMRFPNDAEVRQWHAITYYRWGHDLLNNGHHHKAKACLNKALRLDSQNKSLREAVHSDLRRVEQILSIPMAQ